MMLAKVLVVAALAGVSVAAAPNAQAADSRPCVSKAEFYGGPTGLTQTQLEARWEVADVSRRIDRGSLRYFMSYPFCGYLPSEAAVTVAYRISDHVATVEFLARVIGAKPHGHEAH